MCASWVGSYPEVYSREDGGETRLTSYLLGLLNAEVESIAFIRWSFIYCSLLLSDWRSRGHVGRGSG